MVGHWMNSRVLNVNTQVEFLKFKENENYLEILDCSDNTIFPPLEAI